MSNPLSDAERFIYGKLAANATLTALVGARIYPDPAPANTPFPYVVYQYRGAPPTTVTTDIEPVTQRATFLVLGVNNGPYSGTLEQIADAIIAALQKTYGPVGASGYVYSCSKKGLPFRDLQTPGGVNVRRLGNEFRLVIKDNPT